jgi:2-dehydro-3-deoxygalactonokinase
MQAEKFISCDWGTSHLRLRVVRTKNLEVMEELRSDLGIGPISRLPDFPANTGDRYPYYISLLKKLIAQLQDEAIQFNQPLPLLISGMASSALGMKELPYQSCPYSISQGKLLVDKTGSSKDFPYPVYIISGARTERDVMRGEETLLAGAVASDGERNGLYIFPGTHSKHVVVNNGMAESITTYMTGEFFDLLCSKTVLSNSIERDEENVDKKSFEKGLQEGVQGNLLNTAFGVRTNTLFDKMSRKQNFHYLSGLVIAAELKDISSKNYSAVHLVAGKNLLSRYKTAIKFLYPGISLIMHDADEALLRGQYRIVLENL